MEIGSLPDLLLHIYIYIYDFYKFKCPGWFWLTRPDFADITLLDLCIGSPIFHGVQLLCIFLGFLELFVAFESLLRLILSTTCCYSATIIVFFLTITIIEQFQEEDCGSAPTFRGFGTRGKVRGITSVHVKVRRKGKTLYWTLSILGVAILSLKMHRTSQNYMKNNPYYT